MADSKILKIKTISEFHQLRSLPKPQHPLVSVINFENIKMLANEGDENLVNSFYSIALKKNFKAKMKYGQLEYDFLEGMMTFMSPGQLLRIEPKEGEEIKQSGWLLLIHPDFLWNSVLATNIKKYEFFDYAVSEALFLSDKEENIIYNILKNIEQEYQSNIDAFSQNIIISQIETLLNFSERFYQRQFITRKKHNHQILDKLETLLNTYFSNEDLFLKGLPTVSRIANELNVSPNYLGGLLKQLTGQTTQQIIHEKLLEKAKEKLSTTSLSISEISFELGFEHSQSFSKFFKSKTRKTPQEFRESFN